MINFQGSYRVVNTTITPLNSRILQLQHGGKKHVVKLPSTKELLLTLKTIKPEDLQEQKRLWGAFEKRIQLSDAEMVRLFRLSCLLNVDGAAYLAERIHSGGISENDCPLFFSQFAGVIDNESTFDGQTRKMRDTYEQLLQRVDGLNSVKKFEREVGGKYLGWVPDRYCYGLDLARRDFSFREGDVVLDLGCGSSFDIVRFAHQLRMRNIKVIGIDACPENIASVVHFIKSHWRQCVRELLQYEGERGLNLFRIELRSFGVDEEVINSLSDFTLPDNLSLLNEDMRETSLCPNSVDRVISAHALTDVTAEKSLERVLEVIRTGGEIILSPDMYWKELYAIADRKGISLAKPEVLTGIGASAFRARILSKPRIE